MPHPMSFPAARDCEHDQRHDRMRDQAGRVGLQSGVGEKDRRHHAESDRLQLVEVRLAHARRAANHQARDERAEHRVQSDELRDDAAYQRDDDHRAELAVLDIGAVVDPSHQAADEAVSDEVAEGEKRGALDHQHAHRFDIDGAGRREARHQRQQQPSDGVIDDAAGEDQHPELALDETEVEQDFRDHRDRRNRHRDRHEQRENQASVGVREVAGRQHVAERDAAGERQRDPETGDHRGGAPQPAQNLQLGLEPDVEQQHDRADPRERLEQMHHQRIGGEQVRIQRRREMTEDRFAEQDSGQQLADDGRLVEALGDLGQHAADNQQRRDLDKESQQLRFGKWSQEFSSGSWTEIDRERSILYDEGSTRKFCASAASPRGLFDHACDGREAIARRPRVPSKS